MTVPPCQALVSVGAGWWRPCASRGLGYPVTLDLARYWNKRWLCGVHRRMAKRGVPIMVYAQTPVLVKTSEQLLQG